MSIRPVWFLAGACAAHVAAARVDRLAERARCRAGRAARAGRRKVREGLTSLHDVLHDIREDPQF